MFDGITDIGMDQVNAMGKQSRFRNWKPNWNARDDLKRNQNLYSVGSMADRKYFWNQWMGGWVSRGEVYDNSHVDAKGTRVMLGRVLNLSSQ